MSSITIPLEDEVIDLLRSLDHSAEQSARELIILELYRRGAITSGKASELLGVSRLDFIRYASKLGIPYLQMDDDEWEGELRTIDAL